MVRDLARVLPESIEHVARYGVSAWAAPHTVAGADRRRWLGPARLWPAPRPGTPTTASRAASRAPWRSGPSGSSSRKASLPTCASVWVRSCNAPRSCAHSHTWGADTAGVVGWVNVGCTTMPAAAGVRTAGGTAPPTAAPSRAPGGAPSVAAANAGTGVAPPAASAIPEKVRSRRRPRQSPHDAPTALVACPVRHPSWPSPCTIRPLPQYLTIAKLLHTIEQHTADDAALLVQVDQIPADVLTTSAADVTAGTPSRWAGGRRGGSQPVPTLAWRVALPDRRPTSPPICPSNTLRYPRGPTRRQGRSRGPDGRTPPRPACGRGNGGRVLACCMTMATTAHTARTCRPMRGRAPVG